MKTYVDEIDNTELLQFINHTLEWSNHPPLAAISDKEADEFRWMYNREYLDDKDIFEVAAAIEHWLEIA